MSSKTTPRESARATHRLNPPLQCRIIFKLLSIIRLQDKFILQLRERNARVAIEFGWVLREVAGWRFALVWVLIRHFL